jgi:hypothetical protein
VPDERGDRLGEVRRRGGQPHLELGHPAAVVEVHSDDLGRRHRRQVHRAGGADPATVPGDQLLAVAPDRRDGPVQQDPAVLGHRLPYPAAADQPAAIPQRGGRMR